jgi:type I restriction enzyme S subunit
MKDLEPGLKYVSPSAIKKFKGGSKFQNTDTLFARITPCLENGNICQVKNLDGGIGFGSTEFLVLRGKESVSNSDFIYYLSRTDNVKNKAIQWY